ncbi:MAG: Oar protein [uncultured Pyrinomonadaceae bacterium]|uniref:Oar protein n=1 Tax=uncultured Pyrinomonadaceae bacterium TaxID=2283094 RepID=A0A6J4PEX2_9BACT|nr:MAG: Oar protein [uncultured Pyrinomonadaceae bacterium]
MQFDEKYKRFIKITPAFFLLSVVTLIFSSSAFVSGQAGAAEITGQIRDAAGGGIDSATIIINETDTNQSMTVMSDDDGFYTVTNLKPGLYRATIEAKGFSRFVRERLLLRTGERVRVDVELQIGTLSETVSVSADAPLLRSEASSLGQVIDNRKIVGLPLNGRNFLSLVGLAPGVAQPPRTAEGASFPRINGGRPRVNEYLFDGVSVLQPEPGQIAFFPVVDAIQEFKVEINNPPAEFGRFNGGVINLTTKSGTNDFRGSVFEFFRNEALNARNLFAPANQSKPVFRRNQFGGVLGGRIVKDKTFFFVDYQGTRQDIGRVRTSTVPTLAQRNGNFSSSLGAAIGSTTVLDTNGNMIPLRAGQIFRPSDKRAYAGNIIPLTDFDQAARQLLARYPLPTASGAANNFTRVGSEKQNQDQFDVRIDYRLSDNSIVFGRYSFAKDLSVPVTPLADGSGALTGGAIGTTDTRANSLIFNYTQIFRPNLLNELRVGYTRRGVQRRSDAVVGDDADLLRGIPETAAFRNSLPTISIAGFQQLGSSANTNTDFSTDVTQIYDAVSYQTGRHSFKFGGDFRLERLDVLQPPNPTGQFTFNSVLTNSTGASGAVPGNAASSTGNALASFLLGVVQNFSIDLQPNVLRPRAKILELFVQDDWKATKRLTFNVGVRYTLNFPSTEKDNQAAVFNLETRQLDYLGENGNPESARRLHKLNFAPRVGLAYRLGDKTVVRAGYGVVWQEQAGITTPFTTPFFPFVQTVTQRSLDNRNPAFVLSGANRPLVTPVAMNADAGLGQSVFAVDRDLGSGYTQQWNVGIQRAVTNDLVFEIAYAGSKITHVGIPDTNINQLTVEQLALGSQLQQLVPNPCFGIVPRSRSNLGDPLVPLGQTLRPFPCFSTVSLYRNNVGNTNYHALQAKIEQRFSKNLSFLIAYTRSKLIDEASSVFDATIQTGPIANFPVADSYNRRLERDVSNGDIPNVFVASFTYDFDFFRNTRRLTGKFLKGWSINGIINVQSGIPLAITQVTNFNAFAGFGTQRPNLVGNPTLPPAERTTAAWFNTAAFQLAPQFTIGSSSRNPVRGPGYRNLDLAIIKRTDLTEGMNVEFRVEIFNLTNTPPLGNPNGVLGSAGFGTITTAGDPRVIQFGLKLNF